MSRWNEQAVLFDCEGESLTGILHRADQPNGHALLLIVGGPQYRVGSHRQFVQFARAMAASGTSVFRFDYRGMGDTAGPYLDFEQADKDVTAALDELERQLPTVSTFGVFGLCDAASTALMVSAYDSRVGELILLNPWVRSAESEAKAQVKHYYGKRLFAAAFWKKLLTGKVNVFASGADLLKKLWLGRSKTSGQEGGASQSPDFRVRMREGASSFDGRVLLILSGNDFTANEFEDTVAQSAQWQDAVSGWTQVRIEGANHTFARSDWKRSVVDSVVEWMEPT